MSEDAFTAEFLLATRPKFVRIEKLAPIHVIIAQIDI